MLEYLFIYGSLITGSGNRTIDRCIQNKCQQLGEATIKGKLFDLGDYPGAVPGHHRHNIHGQLIKLIKPAKTLALLDHYEAYYPDNLKQSEFIRERTEAKLKEDGKTLLCWTYWYNRKISRGKEITTGDYEQYLRDKTKLTN